MIAAIRSEIRKLLTVRSTYAIILLCLVLEGIASGYGGGFNAPAAQLASGSHYADEIKSVVSLLSAFIPIIGILLVTHEFRYNTISYSLTAARTRTQVFLAKFVVVTLLALVLTLVFTLLSPLFVMVGTALNGRDMVPQTIPIAELIPKLLFTGWAYSMIGFVISFIARVQVATLVAYFLIPSTVEPLLTLVLKKKQEYLPYISVDGVLNHHTISHMTSAIAACIWIATGLIVGWLLFLKRDAS